MRSPAEWAKFYETSRMGSTDFARFIQAEALESALERCEAEAERFINMRADCTNEDDRIMMQDRAQGARCCANKIRQLLPSDR